MTDPTLSWLWLAWVLGYAPAQSGELLAVYGSAESILAARGKEDLSPFLNEKQAERLLDISIGPDTFAPLAARCARLGIQILPWADPAYPAPLAALPDAPPVLYATGDLSALDGRPCVGMVGSRRPSEYGVRAAALLGDALAGAGAVLVSGLADGLDSAAHTAALRQNAPTVAILGTAIDKTYPAGNRGLRRQFEQAGGVTLSEYPPDTPGNRSLFLQRNRLIAGLSGALCVVEARAASGTMSTVHHAQRYGVPVWAVPGSIFSPLSEGTNALLASGEASALTGAGPLLQSLGLAAPPPARGQRAARRQKLSLSPEAAALLRLVGPTPTGLEALSEASGLATGPLLAALTELELAGQITALAGRQYRRA